MKFKANRLVEADPVIKSKADIASWDTYKRMSLPPGWRYQGMKSDGLYFVKKDKRTGEASIKAHLSADWGSRTSAGLRFEVSYDVAKDNASWQRSAHGAGDEIGHTVVKNLGGLGAWKISASYGLMFNLEKTFDIPRGGTALEVQKEFYAADKECSKVLDKILDEVVRLVDEDHADENALEVSAGKLVQSKENLKGQLESIRERLERAQAALNELPDDPKEMVQRIEAGDDTVKKFLTAMSMVSYLSGGWKGADDTLKSLQAQINDIKNHMKAGLH